MTDKELLQQALDALKMSYELQDNGLINFEEYKLISDADILNKLNITIEAIKTRLAQPEPEYKECRHCGFECRHNNNQSKKWYPLEQPEKTVNGWPLFSGIPQPEPQQYVDLYNIKTSFGVETIASAPYTKPPKKEWVGLTAADLMELVAFTHMTMENALSVEAKLKEKNT